MSDELKPKAKPRKRKPRKTGNPDIGELAQKVEARSGAEPSTPPDAPATQGSGGPGLGVRERDIILFLRQLIMLQEAGTPLLQALYTLAQRSERSALRNILLDVAQFVEMGNPLWQAFARHPRQFDPIFVNLVRASEASGNLVPILERLALYRERRLRFSRKVQTALIYPAVVLLACFGVVILIGRFVLPLLSGVFEKLDAEVPEFTRFFIAAVRVLTSTPFLLGALVVIAALVGLYLWLRRRPLARLRIDRLRLRIPFIGTSILRKSNLIDMCRTMALLLRSGLSMMNTLELLRTVVRNRAVAEVIDRLRESVERGEGLEPPLRDAPHVIPPVAADMLVTGEESGRLDQVADQIAETFEEDVDAHFATLAELLPPVVVAFMGTIVLFLVLAVFWPLLSMIDQLAGGGMGG